MTTILFYKNRVYADSTVFKGSERFDCITKIQAFELPFPILSTQQDFLVDDVVHGYSGTGSQPAILGFVESLQLSSRATGDIHGVIGHFKMAYHGGLLVHGNAFEVVLVGEKGYHSFQFDINGFVYTFHEKDRVIGLGSGCSSVITYVSHHGDPLRAMLQTFALDETSGGWIDVWEMIQVEKEVAGKMTSQWVFRRCGLREPIPRELILHVLDIHWPKAEVDKVPLQFKRASRMRDEVDKIRLENAVLHDRILQFEQDRSAIANVHKQAIAKLKKQIAKLKHETKPTPVKNLKLPDKVKPLAGSSVTKPARRSLKKPLGERGDFR